MPRSFVHLHVHSQYSLLDGACRTADMVRRARELGQDSLAITDHGCLFGVIDFYLKAKAEGVKPIIGIEAYMAPGSRLERTTTGVKDGGYHLLLLAQDRAGYQNLLKLGSIAYTEGFYYKPRIDKDVLRAHSAGLIATSSCLGGEIPTSLMADNRKRAKEIAELYMSIFGPDRFFIEVQKHIPEQDKVNPELMDLAERLGIGCVATNDVHFLNSDDHGPHDALCCISTGKLITEESRMRYPKELYLKSTAEMYSASELPGWEKACDNTARIAGLCNVELDFKKSYAPAVKIEKGSGVWGLGSGKSSERESSPDPRPKTPDPNAHPVGSTAWYQEVCSQFTLLPFDELKDQHLTPEQLKQQCDDALRTLAEAGLVWRYGQGGIDEEKRARLDRELRILADKNIAAYFLIVWDFVNEARRRGIPANARGSGVGTMVGYCLGLSNACPVKYGLLFERFTDPDRSEYPDIDIDICQDGRQAIIDYVRQKYGHVAQIITFGSLKARAAIRDVGRVMNMPLPDVDRICKLVGEQLGMTIGKALETEPDLRRLYDESPQAKAVIDTAKRLEGLSRHAGVHAAGVIIATQPLTNILPLYKPPGTEQIVTQWDGPTCEKVGLLKMDFLGLRTLSIIERAKALIRATVSPETVRATVPGSRVGGLGSGKSSEQESAPDPRPQTPDPLDLERLTFDDPKVFELFQRGETHGIFQFESGGMKNLLIGMKPDRLEDLIAANALFRPGPMDLIPDYNARKHGRQSVPPAHPIVERFTGETYGIMVYQEQVMQIVNGLGSIPLRAAYTLIKNISKKKFKDIDAVRPTFVEGASKQGLSKSQAEELFELILKFAGYGFNKSHSTGYAIIAYQTAYLKTYFPVQYMAAVLTYESVSIEKVVEYIDECRRVVFPDGHRGIDVLPPDINESDVAFTVVYNKDEPRDANHGHIRFGLSAVKGVGDKAIAAIIETRRKGGPFKSVYDFCERIPLGTVNKATIEALIKCGAFDSVHGGAKRAALCAGLEAAIARGAQESALASSEDFLFGAVAQTQRVASEQPKLPGTPPWSHHDQLKAEKEVLGFYVSAHPLDQFHEVLERYSNASVANIERLAADVEVIVGGMLTRVRTTITKNGRSAGSKMAMLTLEDASDAIDAVAFSDTYAITAPLLTDDRIVFLKGRVDRRREKPSIIVNQVIPVEDAVATLTQCVKISLGTHDGATERRSDEGSLGGSSAAAPTPGPRSNGNGHHVNGKHALNGELTRLKELLRQSALSANNARNTAQVMLEVHDVGAVVQLRVNGLRIVPDADLPARIATVLGLPVGAQICELQGPPKLLRGATPPAVLHDDAIAPSQPMLRHETVDEEFCASIDRY